MSVLTQWVRFGPDQAFSGFFARPERAGGPLPGVVVVQELLGVDAHIEDVVQRVALAGYAAFAPDLYATHGDRPAPLTNERLIAALDFLQQLPPGGSADPKVRAAELARRPQEQADAIAETLSTLFAGGFLPKVIAAAAYLRLDQPATRGQKLGAIGFCMGGGLAAMLACSDRELAGAISFYGRSPPPEQIPQLACPLLSFHGSLDVALVAGVPAFEQLMKEHGKQLEVVTYAGAPHAFFNDSRPSYTVGAARDAWVRSLQFLQRTLA
jgi:carboxymethylenebutenolidase